MPAATMHSFGKGFVDPPLPPTTPTTTTTSTDPTSQKIPRCTLGCDMGGGRGRVLMAGSWNAGLYGPLLGASAGLSSSSSSPSSSPSSSDVSVSVSKNRVSGLWNGGDSALARALDARGTRTLLFAGVNTNQCVLGTLLDAYYRGLDCLMLEDCCATTTPGGQEMTVLDVSVSWAFFLLSLSSLFS